LIEHRNGRGQNDYCLPLLAKRSGLEAERTDQLHREDLHRTVINRDFYLAAQGESSGKQPVMGWKIRRFPGIIEANHIDVIT
jgi:hypothetical protein